MRALGLIEQSNGSTSRLIVRIAVFVTAQSHAVGSDDDSGFEDDDVSNSRRKRAKWCTSVVVFRFSFRAEKLAGGPPACNDVKSLCDSEEAERENADRLRVLAQ